MNSKYTLNRSSKILGSFTIILITVFLLGIEGGIFSAKAIDCGDTIGPGEIAILDHDLGPCEDENQILTVEGPAILNLNGFTVTCKEQDGILVMGKRAIILNGTITDCDIGVDVEEDEVGHHKIFNLTVDGYYDIDSDEGSTGIRVRSGSVKNHIFKNTALNNEIGIRVQSENNYLIKNTARNNGIGIRVQSDNNHLTKNTARNNKNTELDGIGIRVQSDNNHLIHNYAESNDKGIRVDGEYNTVFGNKANNNDKENFQLRGAYNQIVFNYANGGDEECFLIEGEYNSLSKNSARNCEDGFVLSNGEDEGNNNRIFNCKAIDNRTNGIVALEGAIDNRIIRNKAFFNDGSDLVDVNNIDCEDNTWKRNKFRTSNLDCIE